MIYTALNIHQKINSKANSLILYPCTIQRNIFRKHILSRDGILYNSTRLMLRADPVKDHEPGEPDYDAPSQAEIQERMYKIQHEIK